MSAPARPPSSTCRSSAWGCGPWGRRSRSLNVPWAPPPADRLSSNPLSRNYRTEDGRSLAFTCLQAGKYWPPLCEAIGRPELATDPRFADHKSLLENSAAAVEILTDVFASATLEAWQECHTASGTPFRLVTAPVQFDEEPAVPGRAPGFNEHGDSILAGIGFDEDAIIDLKVRGVVA